MGRKNTPQDVFRWINTHGNDPDVCWEWTGRVAGRDGRPYITINYKQLLVYRVVFELFNGSLEPNEVVRHKCHNPICCNPYHLEKGSISDNEYDKYEADRAGLPRDVVTDIRRFTKFDMTQRAIVDLIYQRHGIRVSQPTISRIKNDKQRRRG